MNVRTLVLVSAFCLPFSPALAQDAAPSIIFEGDTVRGAGPNVTPKGPVCVLTSVFQRGESIVFRVRLVDPKTGKPIDDKGVRSLHIELSNGEKPQMRHGGHPPQNSTDRFWSTGWIVPQSHPTGSLSYKVVATTLGGQTVAWQPFQVASSQLRIAE